ncbi:MAG: MBL fold metallo-hydrolase, partial [Woeseia sp.]
MRNKLTVLFIALALLTSAQAHDDDAVAHYLANEGLMVAHGDTKILFDPLFREDYGQYRLVPTDMRAALFEGSAPWDGIDAVFISHYHDDHFAPDEMVTLMRNQPQIWLFAPRQAVEAMREFDPDKSLSARITTVNLAYRDAPV